MSLSRQQKEKAAHVTSILKVYACLTKMSSRILKDIKLPSVLRGELLALVAMTRLQVVEAAKTSSRISRRPTPTGPRPLWP